MSSIIRVSKLKKIFYSIGINLIRIDHKYVSTLLCKLPSYESLSFLKLNISKNNFDQNQASLLSLALIQLKKLSSL